jgi:hypothetical protein
LPCGSEQTAAARIGDSWVALLSRLAGFTNQKKERPCGLQPFVKLPCEGYVYSAANEFLCDLQGLRQKILSQRELQKIAQSPTSGSSFRPISSFHTDPRYGGDLHRAEMRPSKKKGLERLPSGCKSKAAGNRWLAELLGITPNECTNYQQ